MGRKFGMAFFWWLMLVQGFFGGFVGSARDFWGFWFLPPFDHPCHFIEIQCTPTKTEAGVTACNDFGFLYARHVWLFRAFFYTYMYSTDFSGCIFCAGLCVCGCTIIFINFIYLLFFLILLLVCMPCQISWCFFPSLCHLLINTWSLS